ncbi:hypothetical protein W97_01358 [Coniosporium apollinis CBS 100218]|uniref:CENP-V/GFA domain-containing protein n=1 Tax=Coniosporium apollinis (strain CBS 100218) TaxID=1168221 RepID=R7YK17_CONA1|nr:uncharacterized protein W97_01358 [Coniosporium apollinis CBS 100218]EON62139.1 hypothetical protein W97_01358 [Coniosporium apollinis CBS 100218]
MGSTVEANWTAHHPRRMAQAEPMFVRGILSGPTAQANDSRYPVPIPTSSTPAADRSTIACGTCFCGAVQLELPLDSEPAISVVCHCTDCREWHSVGSVPYMMFPLLNLTEETGEMSIKVTAGASLLSYVHRTPEVRRYFATCCGTRLFNSVWNEAAGLKLCGTFPTVFSSFEWQPTMHVNVRESNYPTLDVRRFNDLPAEFGGTGTQAE